MHMTLSATALVLLAICSLLFFLLVIKTVILPLIKILQRDFQECHSGGDAARDSGIKDLEQRDTTPTEIKEEKDIEEGDIEDLLAAVDAAGTR